MKVLGYFTYLAAANPLQHLTYSLRAFSSSLFSSARGRALLLQIYLDLATKIVEQLQHKTEPPSAILKAAAETNPEAGKRMSTRNTLLPCFLLIPSNPFQPLATRLTMPSPGDTPSPSAPFAPKRAKTKTCPWDSHAPRACCARGSRFARRNDGPPSPLRRQRLDPRDLENTWTLKRSRNICLARFMFRVPVRFRGVPRRSTKIHKDVLLLEGVRIRHRIVVLHLKKKENTPSQSAAHSDQVSTLSKDVPK